MLGLKGVCWMLIMVAKNSKDDWLNQTLLLPSTSSPFIFFSFFPFFYL